MVSKKIRKVGRKSRLRTRRRLRGGNITGVTTLTGEVKRGLGTIISITGPAEANIGVPAY